MLKGKRVTVAVTGGIAAYKCCEFVRLLVKHGVRVRVAMTKNATNFVGPLTFEALTGEPVALTEWTLGGEVMPHISLNRESDLLVVMPATADILGKAAGGIADDLVSTLIAARRTPVLFVPAMNVHMWRNPACRRNVALLKEDGAFFAGPVEGVQACGDNGTGRMIEPWEVFDAVTGFFAEKSLAGRRVVVTAGPTYEPIDDVRGITNRSSGRQGYAVARAARDAGADVTLVSGPVNLSKPFGIRRLEVRTAAQMLDAVQKTIDENGADLFIGVAAVADWRVENPVVGKIKKDAGKMPLLSFAENPDILKAVSLRGDVALTVGFAAEAQNLENYAREKLRKKGAGMIVGNIAAEALGSSDNRVLFVTEKTAEAFGPADKMLVAEEIIRRAARLLNTEN